MSVTRHAVLQRLAAASDADRRETTTVETLVSSLDADRATIEAHLHGLEACELAHVDSAGAVRVTRTGEELLALDIDDVIVDPGGGDSGNSRA